MQKTNPREPAFKPSLNRDDWLRVAEEGMRPLARLMAPGKADLPLEGRASSHGMPADRLESFSRPCLWAAHWLHCGESAKDSSADSPLQEDVAEWLRRGLVHGTNKSDPEYWGPTEDHHQHSVEMAALVLSLDIARKSLWEPLVPAAREQIAAWLGTIRGKKLHRNNHLFFGVLTLEFLQREGFGKKSDAQSVRVWLEELEGMALGGGWFRDGTNETVDYYNAYAFHYYALWWIILHSASDPSRRARWSEWIAAYLPDHARFFAASGENVPFGRSLTYRFNAIAPFALAERAGISPLPPGLSRRLCSKNLEFFWSRPIRQEQGVIGLGWADVFPQIGERYSCAGSPYWCAKGLSPLLLPKSSEFWRAEEKPLPSEASDFSYPLPRASLVVRSVGGEVELANAGTAINEANTVFGPYKWGKLSYRTGVGFEVQAPSTDYPIDAALTAENAAGALHGRQATRPLAVEPDHLACTYALGADVEVETHIWWYGRWQLQLHRYEARSPSRLLLGGQSLADAKDHNLAVTRSFPRVVWQNRTHRAVMQSAGGFWGCAVRRAVLGGTRTHIAAPCSVAPFFHTLPTKGEGWLAALHGMAPIGVDLPTWEISSAEAGTWTLRSSRDEMWVVGHPALPAAAAGSTGGL